MLVLVTASENYTVCELPQRKQSVNSLYLPEGHLMVSKTIVDGAEFVESLGIVTLQFGCSFKVTDGLPHLSHLNKTLSSHFTRGHIPNASL